jgi:putative membrane protein
MNRTLTGLAALAMNGLLCGAVLAADDVVSPTEFVNKAASGGLLEVRLGQMASDRGNTGVIKDFGKRMAQDHGKNNEELKSIARARGLSVPQQMNGEDHAMFQQLSNMTGTTFDSTYIDQMVSDHKKDIALFENFAGSGSDAELKAFAAKTLPTLRHHLQMAQDAQSSLRGQPAEH